MKRRSFLKKVGVAAAGAVAAPYFLPSGRLFARTGTAMVDHVVYVLFAGGLRQQESILQRYLDDSQGISVQGNVLYNMLEGPAPQQKVLYGTNGQLPGDSPIPMLLGSTIQKQGTTFAEVNSQVVGHYSGLNALITGNYLYTQGLRQKPLIPTIFEYARKHLGLPATKVWFVGNGIGNSTPLLNHSLDENYGVDYAANFMAPTVTFGVNGMQHLSNAKVYHPEEELDPMYKMKFFLDQTAAIKAAELPGVKNTDAEKHDLKQFMREMFDKTAAGTIAHPPVADNGDMRNIGYACEVLQWFKPTLTVVNMSAIDGCHGNFTGYLRSMHRADHGVAHLWNYIQTQIPSMAGNTAMVIIPECGRNAVPNPILDENDLASYDHSDANARRVFGQMLGPGIPSDLMIGSETSPVGEVADGVLTVAELLGFKPEMQSAGYVLGNAQSWFDRI